MKETATTAPNEPSGAIAEAGRFTVSAIAGLLIIVALNAGCKKVNPAFICRDDRQCTHNGEAGVCQPNRQCSFPDQGCDSGQRYGAFVAPALRHECVVARPCGDGIKGPGEDCDDGNPYNGDGCTVACIVCDDSLGDVRVATGDGSCMVRFNEPRSWHKAEAHCEDIGGYLATVEGTEEQALLEVALLGGDRARFWIGHHVDLRANEMEWVTGERIAHAPWHPEGARDPGLGRDCTSMSPGRRPDIESLRYLWALEDCSNERPFICEIPAWQPRPGSDSAYRVLADRQSWDDAQTACARRAGTLVIVDDEAESRFLARRYLGPYWVGAEDREREGTFVWVGGARIRYENFAPGEPDNYRDAQHCLMADRDGYWHDRACDDKHRAVCERAHASTNLARP